jgi:hypothetical protein
VLAHWERSGLWFPATIGRLEGDRYHVVLDDGDQEWVARDELAALNFPAGSRVLVRFGRFYDSPATVLRFDGARLVLRYDHGVEETVTLRRICVRHDVPTTGPEAPFRSSTAPAGAGLSSNVPARPAAGSPREETTAPLRQQESRPLAAAPRPPARLTAQEMLSCLEDLRQAESPWDVIWARLNPSGDEEVQRLLVELRGPHLFAPHLALGAIEVGCRRALAEAPEADALAALQWANQDDRFWR